MTRKSDHINKRAEGGHSEHRLSRGQPRSTANKPAILKPGDRVAIIAPGGQFNRKKFNAGIQFIKAQGLVPVIGNAVFKKDFIFAGTTGQRLTDLKRVLQDDDVKAIWCVRGGYGCYAVAQELAKIKRPRPPKVLIGMSDVTALHLLFCQNWGWSGLHGPLVDRIGVDASSAKEKKSMRESLFNPMHRFEQSKLKSLAAPEVARGVLTGGNLALVAASLKTRWEINTDGKILFLEEIGERAYRLDRMLFQLEMSGKLKHLKGVVLGSFTECIEPDKRDLSLDVLKRYFARAKYPVVYGVNSGHDKLRMTIPFGVKAEITGGKQARFRIIESCFNEA